MVTVVDVWKPAKCGGRLMWVSSRRVMGVQSGRQMGGSKLPVGNRQQLHWIPITSTIRGRPIPWWTNAHARGVSKDSRLACLASARSVGTVKIVDVASKDVTHHHQLAIKGFTRIVSKPVGVKLKWHAVGYAFLPHRPARIMWALWTPKPMRYLNTFW